MKKHHIVYVLTVRKRNVLESNYQSVAKLMELHTVRQTDPPCDKLHVAEANLVHQCKNSPPQEQLSPPCIVQLPCPNL